MLVVLSRCGLVYIVASFMFFSSLVELAISLIESPSKHFDGSDIHDWAGWRFLVFGPLGILIWQFGWLANPLMLLSALPLKRSLKLAFAAAAISIAVSSVTITYVPVLDAKYVVRGTKFGFYL